MERVLSSCAYVECAEIPENYIDKCMRLGTEAQRRIDQTKHMVHALRTRTKLYNIAIISFEWVKHYCKYVSQLIVASLLCIVCLVIGIGVIITHCNE